MRKLGIAAGMGLALGVLAGCAVEQDPFAAKALQKGEQLGIQNIIAANPGKKACFEYEAASNSCSSIITARVEGNRMITQEIAALKIPGSNNTQRVELITNSTIQDGKSCARANDLSVVGRDTASAFVLAGSRQLINEFGGSFCGTYFRSGNGYVVSTVGANGEPFPPGDTRFQFISGDAKLRAQ
ncbi:hypothetical protein [Sulfitobacter donghicola]|uniref:Lipoprotein n=1 Tax=Sulfitobacter donghicola DSW-25 = KCTC 12864 = JCM 14565 TaxID=1300350 RepID=A0A073IIR8_9RHOB|nr:hypothetical protein [Sulfitobacter donghicola]KEJ89649.1 hypothetical protein DSW25_10020 [Sulfitobacter donghicola DSW-25 = KCTC 12864 = JCM 14565]KIN69151.1 hypothetical protein Z948_2890 [Sulfitobacter donghicola DSW-25 = KCTC 12864 = JCM 14565]